MVPKGSQMIIAKNVAIAQVVLEYRCGWPSASAQKKQNKKTGVALLTRHRGHCEPLWAVIPPLQVVLSSACSVASLGRFPSHYLPGRPHLRMGVLADHLFGWGIPSTRQAGHATVHSASSVKSPCGAQGGMTLPNGDLRSAAQVAT